MARTTLSNEDLEERAVQFENEHKFDEAREAFNAALKLNPGSQSALEGRARIALALNEPGAVDHCRRALAFHRSNSERQLRMIATVAGALGSDAIPLFEAFLRDNLASAPAHELLSELRVESGAGAQFADSYIEALRGNPTNKNLLMSYWNTLSRAGHSDAALRSMDANRGLLGHDRDFGLLEAKIANHVGLKERAASALERLDSQSDAQLARAQHRMQTGEPAESARLLESVVHAEPDNLSAWALLELAWRTLGDARHYWLVGQPGLYGTSDLMLSSSQLNAIADRLRTLHGSRLPPLGQSVRGGTQTSGQLFLRNEPEIILLTNALAKAIRIFVEQLPAVDPRHPLLKHRTMGMAFGPSWSVRLANGGYHSAHFHPGGILSSACYISLSDVVAGDQEKPGWLEIGRPPPELSVDLPPLTTIEPKEGSLVLFPSYLFHGTRPFKGGERLTVAFDLVPVPMD